VKGYPNGYITASQYAGVAKLWFALIGLLTEEYGTYSLHRIKATLIASERKISVQFIAVGLPQA